MDTSPGTNAADVSILLPIKVTVEPAITNLPTTSVLSVSTLSSLHIRWLGQAVATRIQELSKQSHVALIPKQATVIHNNLNEILSPNMKISDFLTHYNLSASSSSSSSPSKHTTTVHSPSPLNNNNNPHPQPTVLTASSLPVIHIELQALAEYQPSALHTVRLPDNGIPRTVWQACAFNLSETGRHAVNATLKLSNEIQERQTEEEHIYQAFQYIQRTAGTFGAFVEWLEHHPTVKDMTDYDTQKFGPFFSTPIPWLSHIETLAPELKDSLKIKVCVATYYTDLCRLFQRYGTCHGNNINDVSQYTMQHNQLLHFCQAANMFPIPVSSLRMEETFQTCAVPITKATVILSPQGTQQSKHKHSPVKALTILSFIHALIIISDFAFTNEVNLQTGGKNGPGRAVERMIHDHIVPLSARIVSGSTRRMVHDISNRRWLEPFIPNLRNIFAYYAEIDEAVAAAVQKSFEHHGTHTSTTAAGLSPSKTNDSSLLPLRMNNNSIDFPTLYRERRSIRLNEFARLIVDCGLAPAGVLNSNNASSTGGNTGKGSTTASGGYTLTMNDIRAAYYGAIGLTDVPDYGIDYSGRPREDDPFERLASLDEFIEALVRIGYYRWASVAQLDIRLDAPVDELDRTKKAQANMRKPVLETAEHLAAHQLQLLGPKDPRSKANLSTAAAKAEEEQHRKDATKLLPRNTRRGSILVEDIITVEHNLVRRGSVVGMHPKHDNSSSSSSPVKTTPNETKTETKPRNSMLVIKKPSKDELQSLLMTPRTTAAQLMTTLQSVDTLEKPTRAAEIEIYAQFMRYVIEAVNGTIQHLGKTVPKLVTYDIPSLVKRLNIEAVTVTATLAPNRSTVTNTPHGNGSSNNSSVRPNTAIPSIQAYIPLPTIPAPILEYSKNPRHKHTVTNVIDHSDKVWHQIFEPVPLLLHDIQLTVIEDTTSSSSSSTGGGKINTTKNSTTKGNNTASSSSGTNNKANDTLYEMEDHALGIQQLQIGGGSMLLSSPVNSNNNTGSGGIKPPHSVILPTSSIAGVTAVASHLKPEKDIQKHMTPVKQPFSFRI